MTKSFKLFLACAFGGFALLLQSCGKYDNGPLVSPFTKEYRLCREWQLDELNGQAYPSNTYWDFEEDGEVDMITENNGTFSSQTRYWYWNNDKRGVIIDNMGEIDISKLTRNQLWFDIGGNEYKSSAN